MTFNEIRQYLLSMLLIQE